MITQGRTHNTKQIRKAVLLTTVDPTAYEDPATGVTDTNWRVTSQVHTGLQRGHAAGGKKLRCVLMRLLRPCPRETFALAISSRIHSYER